MAKFVTVLAVHSPELGTLTPRTVLGRPAFGDGTPSSFSRRATRVAGVVRRSRRIRATMSNSSAAVGSQATWCPGALTTSRSGTSRTGRPSAAHSHRRKPYGGSPPIENAPAASPTLASTNFTANVSRNIPDWWYSIIDITRVPNSGRTPRANGGRTRPLSNTRASPALLNWDSIAMASVGSSGRAIRSRCHTNRWVTDRSARARRRKASKPGRLSWLPLMP